MKINAKRTKTTIVNEYHKVRRTIVNQQNTVIEQIQSFCYLSTVETRLTVTIETRTMKVNGNFAKNPYTYIYIIYNVCTYL